jgi:DNA-binding MarR family transcriptional regulator
MSKQAASQLFDRLERGGYLVRQIDPEDRRRVTFKITHRGHRAGLDARNARELVEEELTRVISADELQGFRATLAALGDMGRKIG